CQQLYSTPFTF
nr:immunoglobulin light chain junction region [Mus musculus]